MLLLIRGVVMKKNNIIITITIIGIILITFLVLSYQENKNNGELIELNYDEVTEKLDNKEDFILVISQSTCSHCATYKPKLKEIAADYDFDIYFINIDLQSKKNKEKFLKDFHLSGATPTTMFIKNGKEDSLLNRIEGDISTKKATEKFKKMGFIEE